MEVIQNSILFELNIMVQMERQTEKWVSSSQLEWPSSDGTVPRKLVNLAYPDINKLELQQE